MCVLLLYWNVNCLIEQKGNTLRFHMKIALRHLSFGALDSTNSNSYHDVRNCKNFTVSLRQLQKICCLQWGKKWHAKKIIFSRPIDSMLHWRQQKRRHDEEKKKWNHWTGLARLKNEEEVKKSWKVQAILTLVRATHTKKRDTSRGEESKKFLEAI